MTSRGLSGADHTPAAQGLSTDEALTNTASRVARHAISLGERPAASAFSRPAAAHHVDKRCGTVSMEFAPPAVGRHIGERQKASALSRHAASHHFDMRCGNASSAFALLRRCARVLSPRDDGGRCAAVDSWRDGGLP